MDVNGIASLFEQIGFSATIISAFAWYILKKDKEKAIVDKEIRERHIEEKNVIMQGLESYKLTNEKILQTNSELAEANRIMINDFSSKINNIENNVIEIKHHVSK